jgi:hypothetical protein
MAYLCFILRRFPAFVTLLAVAISVANVSASEETPPAPPDPTTYDLRYQFAPGDVLRYEVTHRASIRSTIDQTTQAAQTKTDSIKLWKVTDVLPNGDIEVMNVVESVHMVNQLPEKEPIEYDSRRDKTPPPGFEDAARAVGVPLSVIRITPSGKVTRRDVKVRQQNLEEDAPIVVRLPGKQVTVGETWDEPYELTVSLEQGGTKSIQTRRHHKLTAVKEGIATIEVKYQVLSPMDAHIEAQLVQRLMDGEVKFDIGAGRVVSQQMDIDKRILGFAGPTSSMHYVMRMKEKLERPQPGVTGQKSPSAPLRAKTRAASSRPPRTSGASRRSR